MLRSIRAAVLVRERPTARRQLGRDVIGRIRAFIVQQTNTNNKKNNNNKKPGDELMREPGRGKAGAHSGREQDLAAVGDQSRRAFENVDELVLLAVPVQERRLAAGRTPREIDAEVL